MPYYLESGEDLERVPLALNLRRKYCKAKRTFELGIWGQDMERVKAITLTTALGSETKSGKSRNSWSQLVRDNRHMREKLRKAGVLAEDCFVVEVSPLKHLLHLHGFYRLKEARDSGKLHAIVSEQWEESHGAKVVWVKNMYDAKGAIAYDVKHAIKNYVGEGYSAMRVLRSRGWLPKGWKKAQKECVKWALDKRDFALDDNSVPAAIAREYVPNKWEVVTDYLRRWCAGNEIVLETTGLVTVVWGTGVLHLEDVIESHDSVDFIES